VGSAAWAEWVVDRDLTYEIDAREIPAGWSTGLVPLTRSRPFEEPPPPPGIFSPNVYHLNPALTDWAYHLTADTPLDDTPDLKAIRAGYPDQPEAQKPPHVMKGDEISAMDWWEGAIMAKTAEDWMAYWTGGKGLSVTSAMEDSGVIRSLQMLTPSKRVDVSRLMVLRTASDFSAPAKGQSAADLLASENSSDSATKLTAFMPSLEAAYRVGSRVVDELSSHWDRYKDHPPGG
jgi:purine nucleoside permease